MRAGPATAPIASQVAHERLAGLTGIPVLGAAPAHASVPNNQRRTGRATNYDGAGYEAGGTLIDATREDLVAVSAQSGPPRTRTMNRCDAGHIDLSGTAFQRFAGTDVGVLNGSPGGS